MSQPDRESLKKKLVLVTTIRRFKGGSTPNILSMQVQFEYTVDDLIDVTMRGARQKNINLSWRWSDFIFYSLVSGFVTFWISKAIGFTRLFSSVLVGTIIGIFYIFLQRILVKHRIRKICVAQMNGSQVGQFQIELHTDGYWIKQNNVEKLYHWGDLVRLIKNEEIIEFYSKVGDVTVVRSRAFDSPIAYQNFYDLAELCRLKNQTTI
jgi:hypothetical protein